MSKNQMLQIAIGLIAIPVLAACSSSGDQDSAVATSVAATIEAQRPTAASPTAIPATPVPTQAPLSTAIPSNPADALGAPNGSDPFDNANNWTLLNNDCFATTITGGKFVMEAKGALELSCWRVSWPLIKDYYYQSEVVMPVECNASGQFLAQVQNVGFTDSGKIGYFVRAAIENEGFVVQFDNLTVWLLNQ